MIELEEQQKGEAVEQLNGYLKDVCISSESSPFRHVEVVSKEDLQITEQAAYARGKEEAESNLQEQLELMKAEYATKKEKKEFEADRLRTRRKKETTMIGGAVAAADSSGISRDLTPPP